MQNSEQKPNGERPLNAFVVNLTTGADFDVYIGRGSMWGNPFTDKPLAKTKAQIQVASRQEAISRYEDWIMQQPDLLARLSELKNKILGCYCRPFSCHGDILVRLANAIR